MAKKNSKINILILVIVILCVFLFMSNRKSEELDNYENMTEEEIAVEIEKKVNQMEINDLAGLGERDRMELYVSKFIKALESKKYDDAYELLYEDFRKNYFNTIESFEEYVKVKFPSKMSLQYNNIERNGDIYILWVTVSDLIEGKESGIEMNFVVKENELNDFVLSFSVI